MMPIKLTIFFMFAFFLAAPLQAQTKQDQGAYTIEGYPATRTKIPPEVQAQIDAGQRYMNEQRITMLGRCAAFYDAQSKKIEATDKKKAEQINQRSLYLKKYASYIAGQITNGKDVLANVGKKMKLDGEVFGAALSDKDNPLIKMQATQCDSLEQSLKGAK